MPSFEMLERVPRPSHRAPERQRDSGQQERTFRSYVDTTPLASALTRAGIRPYTCDSVVRYKEVVVAESDQRFHRVKKKILVARCTAHYADRPLRDGEMLGVAITAVFVSLFTGTASWLLGTAISLIMFGTWVSWGEAYLGNLGLGSAFVFGTLLAYRLRPGFLRRMTDRWHRRIANRNARYKWAETDLATYTRRIPTSVQTVIGRLTQECPAGTKFTVEYVDVDEVPSFTQIDQEARDLANDPFLWVAYGGERFPVAVWDERKACVAYA